MQLHVTCQALYKVSTDIISSLSVWNYTSGRDPCTRIVFHDTLQKKLIKRTILNLLIMFQGSPPESLMFVFDKRVNIGKETRLSYMAEWFRASNSIHRSVSSNPCHDTCVLLKA